MVMCIAVVGLAVVAAEVVVVVAVVDLDVARPGGTTCCWCG